MTTTERTTKLHTNPDGSTVEVPADCIIGSGVFIHPSGVMIGANVVIEDNVQIFDNAVIGHHVTIGAGSTIEYEAAILMGATIDSRAAVPAGFVVTDNPEWNRVARPAELEVMNPA